MNSIGSIWRKWDLHIHTPASFHWIGKRLQQQTETEREETCKAIVEKMNSIDVDAFCIMDYWIFDGYLAVRDYVGRNPGVLTKKLFPGIELRLEAPTNFRLNTHVLFDDALLPEHLQTFLARLNIGGASNKPPSRQNLIDLANSFDLGKLRVHGYKQEDKTDDEKMLELGLKTAVISRDSLEEAMSVVGRDHCLLIQPYDTNDGLERLDWKQHPCADTYLMKMADMFETRNQDNVDLFLGVGIQGKPHVGEEFIQNLGGLAKPVVSGSDAHTIEKYGVYPSNRITWLKAQPTFAGLRQVCYEPALRCFIGIAPSKQEHLAQNSTKYMSRLQIKKVDGASLSDLWFAGTNIPLNPGLIAVIGNKGTGKSALADILALAGNTHCTDLEFLNPKRFRKGSNIAKHFKAKLTWADDTFAIVALDQAIDVDQPERVRYLPQEFIEHLCTEIETGGGNFETELKKVIFSHVPEDDRLQKASLDELIDYRIAAHRKAASQSQVKLHALNSEILKVERELSPETIKAYRTALSLKQAELEAHDKTRPAEVSKPTVDVQTAEEIKATADLAGAQSELTILNGTISPLTEERSAIVAKTALLDRLAGHLDNFESYHENFVDQVEEEFIEASLRLSEILKVSINRIPLTQSQTAARDRLAEIAVLINGTDKEKGLEAKIESVGQTITRLRSELGTRQREYQTYLSALTQWQARRNLIVGSAEKLDTIDYLKARIAAAEEVLPAAYEAQKEARRQLVRDIHGELLKIRAVYQNLYEPVQKMAAASAAFTKEPLELDFDAGLSASRFQDGFLEYIHRNRIGTFYGDEESKKAVQKLVGARDFNVTEDVVTFLDDVMTALTTVERGGTMEAATIQSQLKDPKRIDDLYDFLFSLKFLEMRYALKLGGKDIAQLSSGEKGALLLVFYLLLDPEEIPIIIDQPEQNLDNESVVKLLVDCIRQARSRRQVIIITHNPNLAVVCDADQVISCKIDKANGNKVTYECGAIEDQPLNEAAVNVLEGTYPAFDNRRKKYHKPLHV
jgi:ABC-type lipoprotein export system ATPase subunit/predicted metal-dependent phosphoesterase TrpH